MTGEVFSKLGRDMKAYTYKEMWAVPPMYDGIYDVDDCVTGRIRTDGPVVTFNGAWAQSIAVGDTFIVFMGDKAVIRCQYGSDFTVYTAEYGGLVRYYPEFTMVNHFEEEIKAFVDCIVTGEKLPSHIDTVIITARIMQAIYDSAEEHREISFV